MFDIALGFEQEATGWENICFRGYLQGETPRTIKSKMQPIAEFSELGDFLNMQVRYYSAGMRLRLAFSIATAIEPEILLVDEVLSVGDMAFMEKAGQRMRDMMDKAQLIVMVSHDLEAIKRLCQRRGLDGSRPNPHDRPARRSDRCLYGLGQQRGPQSGGLVACSTGFQPVHMMPKAQASSLCI